MSWEMRVLELLGASLLRPFALVVTAALVLRLFRVSHPASRHAVWTAVLIGMLVLPFTSVLAPHVKVAALPEGTLRRIDILQIDRPVPRAATPTAAVRQQTAAVSPAPIPTAQPSTPPATQPVGAPRQSARALPLGTILVWVYLAGVLLFATYRVVGWALLRRVYLRSHALRQRPLRESEDATVPFAIGILRPAVVLPSNWRQWDITTRRSILTHEIAHLRRRDTSVLALSHLAKCLLWFHPMAWWVSRKISELAEMSCDAAALAHAHDPARYAKILLDFSSTVNREGQRASLPELAMVGRSPLSRRIEEILSTSASKLRRLNRPLVILGVVGVPALCAAATLQLTEAVPLIQVKQFITGKLESTMPGVFSAPTLSALSLSLLGEPAASQAPQLAPQSFFNTYCVECHTDRQRIGGISFENRDLTRIQQDSQLWEKVALRLRSPFDATPAGKPRPGAATVRSIAAWLEGELDRNAPPYMPAAGPHRLNRTEYGNAIRDLLAIDLNPALLFKADDYFEGFDTIVKGLEFSKPTAEQYKDAADKVVSLVLSGPNRRSLTLCQPSEEDPDAAQKQWDCAHKTAETIATRAYRRPATEEDIEKLMRIYDPRPVSARTTRLPHYYDSEFARIVGNMLKAVLADSNFLVRTEAEPTNAVPGQPYRISDMELASRLSFFLWSTGPDAQLIEIAGRGELKNPAVLERETRRMLKDPRAAALTTNFASQWLWLRGLDTVNPMASYTDFDEPLRQAMRRETELFFSSIVQEDRNVLDLLNANYTFVNARLARHYGIPNISGSEFRRVTLGPQFDVRRGLLGKASLLTLASTRERTSIVFRAADVLRKLLGTPPPAPPPNVPPLQLNPKQTLRQNMESHNANVTCRNCHRLFDPVGISLENFDLAGKWRTTDNKLQIDTATELSDGTKLNGPADLRNALLARSDLFVRNLTIKLMTYGLGRGVSHLDMPLVRSIASDAAKDNNRFSAIVLGIVRSPTFQMNAK